MGINRVDISRNVGESLFVGPGAFGVMPNRGAQNRDRIVLRHSLSDDAKLFTPKGIIETFPARGRGEVPGRAELEGLFRGLFEKLPFLTSDDRDTAFRILEFAVAGGDGHVKRPNLMKNLGFENLYFIVAEDCRAMIYAALNPVRKKQVDFNVWAGDETSVATHERVLATLGDIAERKRGVVVDKDVADSQKALAQFKHVIGGRSHYGLRDMMGVLNDPQFRIPELVKKYRERRSR